LMGISLRWTQNEIGGNIWVPEILAAGFRKVGYPLDSGSPYM